MKMVNIIIDKSSGVAEQT
jgi:hypothetical protein